ncbi:hypothetical protein GGI07_001245 [Coemansia sp. Benny D115]|nr:hypothetical protein GGI07_001245 [Coemansia sp. Benny D115]
MLLGRYKRVIFLGDSNSDNGNVHHMTSQTHPTHGCATIDNTLVAGTVPMPDGTRAKVPSVSDQVQILYKQVGTLQKDDLVFIQVGSNDLNSLITTGPLYETYSEFTVQDLATKLAQAVDFLHKKMHARQIILLNVRPRNEYPGVIRLNIPEVLKSSEDATISLNQAIAHGVGMLQDSMDAEDVCKLVIFDTYGFQKQLTKDPRAFGIDPAVSEPALVPLEPLLTPGAKQEYLPELKRPETKLFLDDAHFAKRPQALLAAEVVKAVAILAAGL